MRSFVILYCCIVYATASKGKAPTVTLNNGIEMPTFGIGTWPGFDEKGNPIKVVSNEISDAVKNALDTGYRMVDTAAAYDDEDQVGKGVAESTVDRKDVFIVTKLAWDKHRAVLDSLKDSLKKLKMDYVDLFLIHSPVAIKENMEFDVVDYLDTWKSMDEAYRLGLAKSIGLSNFNSSQIQRILDNSEIKPAVLQVEVNLNLAQDDLIDYCKSTNITIMAYTPFGSLFNKKEGSPAPKVDDPVLQEIAKKYNKTVPQVVLKFLHQRGLAPIPKSVKKERIEQNIDIFDFELSKDEMDTLHKFNKNYRIVLPSFWQDYPYYPFERVEKPVPNPFTKLAEKKDDKKKDKMELGELVSILG